MFLDIMTFEQTAPLVLPSPCGDELFPNWIIPTHWAISRYRPLTRINCFERRPTGDTSCSCSYCPLTGMNCFQYIDSESPFCRLPSPRGDELFLLAKIAEMKANGLPSPRGDELFRGERMTIEERKQLPSPRGDELFLDTIANMTDEQLLPSPRGDELFRPGVCWRGGLLRRLPSPRGDELFLGFQEIWADYR